MIRKLQGLALTSAALLMLSGCTGWQSALDVHGAAAISLKQLILLIVVVCSIVWTLVMIALIFALWRKRDRREQAFRNRSCYRTRD